MISREQRRLDGRGPSAARPSIGGIKAPARAGAEAWPVRAAPSDRLAAQLARAVQARHRSPYEVAVFPTHTMRPILARGTGGSKDKEKKQEKKSIAGDPVKREIDRYRKELEELATFYITDWHEVPEGMRIISSEVNESRRARADERSFAGSNLSMALGTVPSGGVPRPSQFVRARERRPDVTAQSLRTALEKVREARAGACTSFGYAAAAILMDNPMLRVEVIARNAGRRGTHIFVLVGRPEGSDVTIPETWLDSTWLVDPWYGAAGHPVVQRARGSWIESIDPDFSVVYPSSS